MGEFTPPKTQESEGNAPRRAVLPRFHVQAALPPVRRNIEAAAVPLTSSANFEVFCSDPEIAVRALHAAENARRSHAFTCLGKELPSWGFKARLHIILEDEPLRGPLERTRAQGTTQFVLDPAGNAKRIDLWLRCVPPRENPTSLQNMTSTEFLIRALVPHEVGHAVLRSHLGSRVGPWFDEGMVMALEGVEERWREELVLSELKAARGIPMKDLLGASEVPKQVDLFYSQSKSVIEFLRAFGGDQRVLDMAKEVAAKGASADQWEAGIRKYYGYGTLNDFTRSWLHWLDKGKPTESTWDTARGDRIPVAYEATGAFNADEDRIAKVPGNKNQLFRSKHEDVYDQLACIGLSGATYPQWLEHAANDRVSNALLEKLVVQDTESDTRALSLAFDKMKHSPELQTKLVNAARTLHSFIVLSAANDEVLAAAIPKIAISEETDYAILNLSMSLYKDKPAIAELIKQKLDAYDRSRK